MPETLWAKLKKAKAAKEAELAAAEAKSKETQVQSFTLEPGGIVHLARGGPVTAHDSWQFAKHAFAKPEVYEVEPDYAQLEHDYDIHHHHPWSYGSYHQPGYNGYHQHYLPDSAYEYVKLYYGGKVRPCCAHCHGPCPGFHFGACQPCEAEKHWRQLYPEPVVQALIAAAKGGMP